MAILETPLSGMFFPLWRRVSSSALTFQVKGRFVKDSTTDYAVGKHMFCFGLREERAKQELFYMDVATAPTLIDADDGIYEYTIASIDHRGIESDNTVAPPTKVDSTKRISHEAGQFVGIVIDPTYFAQLDTEFSSNTTSETKTSGEAFAIRSQLSLHTDGKYYKYHSTNYPNWAGAAVGATTAADESFTIAYPGYELDGFTGLTVGARQYAENTGATTETSSTTTYWIGKSTSATKIKLQSSANPITEATDAQARIGTATGAYSSPARVFRAIQSGNHSYGDSGEGTDAYIIGLNPALTVYYTGMQIKLEADVANTGAATLDIDGVGAKAITKNGTTALEDGDIAAGQVVTLVYDGTQFQLQTASAKSVIESEIIDPPFSAGYAGMAATISSTTTFDYTFTHGMEGTPATVFIYGTGASGTQASPTTDTMNFRDIEKLSLPYTLAKRTNGAPTKEAILNSITINATAVIMNVTHNFDAGVSSSTTYDYEVYAFL